jgi:hypothetical protein
MANLGHYFQQNPLYKSQPFFFDRQVAKKKAEFLGRTFLFTRIVFFFASERKKDPFSVHPGVMLSHVAKSFWGFFRMGVGSGVFNCKNVSHICK